MFPISKPLKGFPFWNPAATDFSISLYNSSIEPIRISSVPSSFLQIGNGIPQYLERDKFQSLAFFIQFPKRPSPVDFGFQLMVSLI
jgi:hypothetical protein